MPLTITLQLTEPELDYFRTVLERSRVSSARRAPEEVTEGALREVARLRATARSSFVLERIDRVERLVAMLRDPDWQLPDAERARVLAALAYVGEAHDLVPDGLPVLGLLDDAIMLELLLQHLQPELESYDEFDAYRRDELAGQRPGARHGVSRQDWLDSRREALHVRILQRRDRALERCGGSLELITHS
jgi:uncharacterized membrane protein YkvA (DUF1232 family)